MRKQKILNVEFADGDQQLPSSVKVKCTVTGNQKSFYTPYLVKLIKRKYNNCYQKFIDTYVSKEGRGLQNKRKVEGNPEEVNDLSGYKQYLLLYLNSVIGKSDSKSRTIADNIRDVWQARFSTSNLQEELAAL